MVKKGFKLSKRSLNNLVGVDPRLVACVHRAIEITPIDFGVIEGVRTLQKQKELVASGASQTMDSKHLRGEAVDVLAYIGTRGSWELELYPSIADAFKMAATELNVSLRWGAAWHRNDIRDFSGSMSDLMMEYIDLRRSQGRRPFIDAVHFELS